jgi:hypothetical protein
MILTLGWIVAWSFAQSTIGQGSALPISATVATNATEATPLVDVTLRLNQPVRGPYEVARFARARSDEAWRIGGVVQGVGSGEHLSVRGQAGFESLVLLRIPDHAGYVLHGPFRWPAQSETIPVAVVWRRTVRGRLPDAGGSAPTWLAAGEETTQPACALVNRSEWECIGVPLGTAGVFVHSAPGRVIFSIARGEEVHAGVEHVVSHAAGWGRLVIVIPSRDPPRGWKQDLRVTARRLRVPRARPQSVRLDVQPDDRVRIETVGPGASWIAGSDEKTTGYDGWIEVAGKGLATTRVRMMDIVGPADVPMRLTIDPSVSVMGIVTSAPGVGAPGAIVALYRFAPERETDAGNDAKRIAIGEQTTDRDGAFHFDDLQAEKYEIVAMHPHLGRTSRQFEPDGQEIDLRLRAPSRVVGRVIRDGVSASRIPVGFVPSLTEFASSRDIMELRGEETTTDRDGRFNLALPARGRGEVRIGDERLGVRRIPLSPAESLPPVVDVGTIQLDPLPSVTLVLESSEGCELLLTGPAARTGMTVLKPVRTGPAMFQAAVPEPGNWYVVAVCGGRERAVVPAIVAIVPGTHDRTIRLAWPQ